MTAPGRVSVTAEINGSTVTEAVEPRATLAQFLRDQLGLTGTKVSCEMQVCGVCSVLVDGAPVSACSYLAADVDGCRVETVEGLGGPDGISPLQEEFVDHFALQCGFCTPGFLMMATALLRRNPNPTEEDVKEYLDGNICRCTGYEPIVQAVLAAAARGNGGGDG